MTRSATIAAASAAAAAADAAVSEVRASADRALNATTARPRHVTTASATVDSTLASAMAAVKALSRCKVFCSPVWTCAAAEPLLWAPLVAAGAVLTPDRLAMRESTTARADCASWHRGSASGCAAHSSAEARLTAASYTHAQTRVGKRGLTRSTWLTRIACARGFWRALELRMHALSAVHGIDAMPACRASFYIYTLY